MVFAKISLNNGGTAFPTCLYWLVLLPKKIGTMIKTMGTNLNPPSKIK